MLFVGEPYTGQISAYMSVFVKMAKVEKTCFIDKSTIA